MAWGKGAGGDTGTIKQHGQSGWASLLEEGTSEQDLEVWEVAQGMSTETGVGDGLSRAQLR